jgi:hypothetical protein
MARKRSGWMLVLPVFLIATLAGDPADAASNSLLERYAALTTLSKRVKQSPRQDRLTQNCYGRGRSCNSPSDCCSGLCPYGICEGH